MSRPAGTVTVHHGTSQVHRGDIEHVGLNPPHGHGRGVRVSVTKRDARQHAAAWAAFYMATREIYPKGCIATATISAERIGRDPRGGGLRVLGGIRVAELTVETFELPELRDPAVCDAAIQLWERLTKQSLPIPKGGVRRS